MIHLQNLPHLHNDRDAIRFQRCAAPESSFLRCGDAARRWSETVSSDISAVARMRIFCARISVQRREGRTLAGRHRRGTQHGQVCCR
jgi:hypothetical protein